MKKFIFIFMISLLAASCGQKAESSKAKFKIFSGNLEGAAAQAAFPGGLMVMGRSVDGSQSFKVLYQPGVELDLKKGGWDFATIGWVGANPMEGNQKCAFQHIDIQSDIFTVNFNMDNQSCLATFGVEGNRFTAPNFYKFPQSSLLGFKKLKVKVCSLYTNCSSGGSFYLKVEVLADLKGIISSVGVGPGLTSLCVASGVDTSITPPYGGAGGFIGSKITTYSDANCTTEVKSYYFNHGFADKLDQSDSTGVIRKGVLSEYVPISPSENSFVVSMVLAPFGGEHLDPTSITGLIPGSRYIYKGVSTLTASSINALPGDYLFHNGTNWLKFTPSTDIAILFLEQ